jgi:hypothetical protein
LHVIAREPAVVGENLLGGPFLGQAADNDVDGRSGAANDRLAGPDGWVADDSFRGGFGSAES